MNAPKPSNLHDATVDPIDDALLAHLGTRYSSAGIFLPEPGNTMVCHLQAGSETEAVLQEVRERYRAMPGSERLAFTAESSLHMTLFQGIIEYRRRLPYWPADVPLETPIDDMTAIFLDRLAGFEPGQAFQMQVVAATPNGLTLEGVSEADRAALRSWRDRLADLLGYRHPDHETYSFHITFAYMTERFDDETMMAWQPFLAEVVEEIRQRAPILALRPPAFCSFEDMNHFEELLVLEPQS
ncbi:DUF1868 domain-containing protein [Rhizobium wuzhouense]|uniref:DUF1868 domain-containing protein n=1 Tax=Rhizobium wuzhouense TaxID=1986026 RepID=A0ABX5NU04_9HYPH|nr:DUF1868 domain-containing protein [Rhizobium wuzhouense]PYB75473.1 DUF1868 domain-containing protein [Rhizobium wuzhouense]